MQGRAHPVIKNEYKLSRLVPRRRFGESNALNSQVHSTIGASAAVLGSSLVGLQLERWIPSGGILGTLLVAAGCSNVFSWVPSIHPLYDACWTWVLPASLAFLLLAYRPPPKINGDTKPMPPSPSSSIAACIRRVAGPFVVASIGSLLGCWISYHCALRLNWFGSMEDARAATGCLAASYVGGSVNFFATARLIGAHPNLLGSMATADLLAMALYFFVLSASLEWKWLQSKFRGNTLERSNSSEKIVDSRTSNLTTRKSKVSSFGSTFLASIPLLAFTWLLVSFANRIEAYMSRWIPGMACAVIAVFAPLINSLVNQRSWWPPFGSAAAPLGEFLFLAFFASVGVGANLQSTLQMGPSCLLFSVLALAIHLVVTVVGSLPFPTVALEDAWIASNAAIGGPATAAAFCNRMRKDPTKLRGRTLAATVWGVVGYAIGTALGVTMFRLLGGHG